ncbi:hypothetical protein LIER_13925 [Lithospermum erythrorhizon]|uniref:Uncharacterized protein n=1 Tax=Lithospermum erythrorhizon TaxID=34254 RepID=A0AAV3PZ52_LITER
MSWSPGLHEATQKWLQATSASRASADGHSTLYQQTQDLSEELTHERLKVEALEQELLGLRLQASNHPSDMALLDQELKRAQAEREDADRAALPARWEREALQHAYLQVRPLICLRIGAAVLSHFVMYSQKRTQQNDLGSSKTNLHHSKCSSMSHEQCEQVSCRSNG